MKKFLSVLLVFMLSLTFVGMTNNVNADTAEDDVTINLHIHQFDGDYTNTGTGIWDGVDWNNWADVVTSEDDFGGVVTKTYTQAQFAALATSVEFKPTRNASVDDAANLLAPASVNGQVFLDITAYQDGAGHVIDLYYVEGAKDFYVSMNDNAYFFNVYANPEVAANAEVYTDWGMHTWNAGTGGSGPEWTTPVLFEIDMELMAGGFVVPAKLGVLEVGTDAAGDAGFIVHKGDSKSCPNDMFYDGGAVATAGALIEYYQHGSCEFAADSATFLSEVGTAFEINSGNRLVEGTQVTNPNTLAVVMLEPNTPMDLVLERFMVKNSKNQNVTIDSVMYPVTSLGHYTSDVTIESETVVIVYVTTGLPAAEVALVGSMQGWSPENGIMNAAVAENGDYVYEFSTFDATAEFKFLHDADANGFAWGDAELVSDNIVLDLSAGGTIIVHFDDATDMSQIVNLDPIVVDETMYTYTSAATCADGEKLLTVFVETDMDHTLLGLVGTINGWDVGNSLPALGETTDGLVVWEVCSADANGEFKVKYDPDGDGFTWDSGTDPELTPENRLFDFGDETDLAIRINVQTVADASSYVPTLTPTSNYLLSVYMNTDLDPTMIGLVGSFNDWDIENPIMATKTDEFGNQIFDILVNSKDNEFAIAYDVDGDGFTWDDKFSGDDNLVAALGAETSLIQYLMIDEELAFTLTDIGTGFDDIVTTSANLKFAEGTLKFGETYTVYYVDTVASEGVDEEVIMMEMVPFNLSNSLVAGDGVTEMGTYAISPDKVNVVFADYTPLLDSLMITNKVGQPLLTQSYMLLEQIGSYTATTTCAADHVMVYVHVAINTAEVTDMAQLGLVGTINGWDIDNTIAPTGMDSEGNYVFEVCVWDAAVVAPLLETAEALVVTEETEYAAVVELGVEADIAAALVELDAAKAARDTLKGNLENGTAGAFKVKFDPDSDGFTWDGGTDPELTPGDIAFTVADGPSYLVVEGASAANASMNHVLTLPDWQQLDKTETYKVVFTDMNGFKVYVGLDMDNEAPTIDFSVKPNVDFELDTADTSVDLLDFYTKIQFLDNRDGEMAYEVVTPIDLSMAGEQTMVIKAVDEWMNEGTFEIMFTVLDTTAPVLTVDATVEFDAGSDVPDWTMYASTNEGTITVDDSQVDMDTVDSFFVNFTAEDEAGNKVTKSLEVTINAVEDTTKVENTGCGSSLTIGASIVALVAVLGGATLFFIRKP